MIKRFLPSLLALLLGLILGRLSMRDKDSSPRAAGSQSKSRSAQADRQSRPSSDLRLGLSAGTGAEDYSAPGVLEQMTRALARYKQFTNAEFVAEVQAQRASQSGYFRSGAASLMLLCAWAEKYPEEAVQHCEPFADFSQREWGALYKGWASIDPVQALAHANERHKRSGISTLPIHVISIKMDWLKGDPRAAMAWISENQDKSLDVYHAQYMSSIARQNPRQALEELRQLRSDKQPAAAAGIASQWGLDHDWEGVLSNLKTLPPELQRDAQAEALKSFAVKSPYEAAVLLSAQTQNSHLKDQAVRNVLNQMEIGDYTKSLEWAIPNLTTAGQGWIVHNALQTMISKDPEQAGKWLLQRPPSPQTNRMMATFLDRAKGQEKLSAEITERLKAESQ